MRDEEEEMAKKQKKKKKHESIDGLITTRLGIKINFLKRTNLVLNSGLTFLIIHLYSVSILSLKLKLH